MKLTHDKNKFKTGDKVKVIACYSAYTEVAGWNNAFVESMVKYLGGTYVVKESCDDGVSFEDNPYRFPSCCLELVEPAKEPVTDDLTQSEVHQLSALVKQLLNKGYEMQAELKQDVAVAYLLCDKEADGILNKLLFKNLNEKKDNLRHLRKKLSAFASIQRKLKKMQ